MSGEVCLCLSSTVLRFRRRSKEARDFALRNALCTINEEAM
jgi:hypothetical protein